MTAFDALAEFYDSGRIGYANEVYDNLVGYGLAPRHHVLDVGCGTGLASRLLIENGFRVTGLDSSEAMLAKAREYLPAGTWVAGSAERLPFEAASFDAAISAQMIHHTDASAVLAEMKRVVRPWGIVAVWWRSLMTDDPVRMLSANLLADFKAAPPPSGVTGRGFKEFYMAGLVDPRLRVIPWQTALRLRNYMRYQRSRKNLRASLGARAEEYFTQLERRLREHCGSEDPLMVLSYLHFLYLGRTPAA